MTGRPKTRAFAAQMWPFGGARTWVAVKGRQAPSRISPTIESSTDGRSSAPGTTVDALATSWTIRSAAQD